MRKKFVLAYIEGGCTNATAAAKEAGYKSPTQRGSELLRDAKIQAYIADFWEKQAMGAAEVLARLAEQARSPQGNYFRDGEFDLQQFVADGYGHLIKKVWTESKLLKADGDTVEEWIEKRRVEFYDGQTALVWIGKHHKLFTDKIDHGGEVAVPITIIDYGLDDDSDDADDDDASD